MMKFAAAAAVLLYFAGPSPAEPPAVRPLVPLLPLADARVALGEGAAIVELLAVTRGDAPAGLWWSPGGTLLAGVPKAVYRQASDEGIFPEWTLCVGVTAPAGWDGQAIARVVPLSGGIASIWQVGGSLRYSTDPAHPEARHGVVMLRTSGPAYETRAAIEVGVATGEFVTLASVNNAAELTGLQPGVDPRLTIGLRWSGFAERHRWRRRAHRPGRRPHRGPAPAAPRGSARPPAARSRCTAPGPAR